MTAQDKTHADRWRQFKCCTFQPFVPNFTLGALLEDQAFSAPFTIGGGEHFWQPLGLVPGWQFRQRHQRTPDHHRGADLVCDFYDLSSRACRIWEYRPSECRGFFCPSPSPEWTAHTQTAFDLEVRLAQQALLEAGFNLSDIHRQVDALNEPADLKSWDPSTLVDLYQASWKFVRANAQSKT